MRVALVQSSWRRHMRKGVAADTLGGHALIFGVDVCIGNGVGMDIGCSCGGAGVGICTNKDAGVTGGGFLRCQCSAKVSLCLDAAPCSCVYCAAGFNRIVAHV
eukprot:COSAG01_NODE_57991_length_308_cov_43.861244_1_plen_102_part_11